MPGRLNDLRPMSTRPSGADTDWRHPADRSDHHSSWRHVSARCLSLPTASTCPRHANQWKSQLLNLGGQIRPRNRISSGASKLRALGPSRAEVSFAEDSPLEESGFELAVPSDGAVPKHERYLPVATLSGFGAGGHRNLPKAGKQRRVDRRVCRRKPVRAAAHENASGCRFVFPTPST